MAKQITVNGRTFTVHEKGQTSDLTPLMEKAQAEARDFVKNFEPRPSIFDATPSNVEPEVA